MMTFETYLQNTYAAWLGKLIGIRLGAPVENWTAQQIKDTYGTISGYLVDYGIFAADDDSNGPLFFVRSLLEEMDEDIDVEIMGNTLLNYISDGHGFFWWGGEGISTEDTVYQNLKKGLKPPQSGSAETNGIALAEQIGGQIFSDCWGYVSCGNPEVAKKLAQKMSSITHDQNGIYGGVFIAVCIALAYEMSDCKEVVKQALKYIPENSDYAHVVKDILDQYEKGLEQSACLTFIQNEYGYDKYPGVCHIIPNTAIMIMAMVYGENDFSKTLIMLCEAGWDTDCTCGNVGSIMGALVGLEGIDTKWIYPINDLLLSSSGVGYLNIDTVSSSALLFSWIGAKLNHLEIDERYLEMQRNNKKKTYFFDLPHSTQAFVSASNRYSEVNLANEAGALKCIINQGFPGFEGKIYKRTYYTPEDVYDCRYQPSFSPTLYAGEIIIFYLSNPKELKISFQLYVRDRDGHEYYGDVFSVGKEKSAYSYQLKGPKDATYIEFGLNVIYQERVMHSYFLIHEVQQKHSYCYEIDWKNEKMENWGLDFGGEQWQEVSQCTSQKNHSYISENGLLIKDDFIIFGNSNAKMDIFEIEFEVLEGKTMGICFDVKGFMHYKMIGFENDEIYLHQKKENSFIKTLISSNFVLNQPLNLLRIERKNDLIVLVVNGDDYAIECINGDSDGGAIGVQSEEDTKVRISCCKLESF